MCTMLTCNKDRGRQACHKALNVGSPHLKAVLLYHSTILRPLEAVNGQWILHRAPCELGEGAVGCINIHAVLIIPLWGIEVCVY